MKKNLARGAALVLLALCLPGCATGPQAVDASNPYHVENAAPVVHGEASVQYGHTVGN